MIAARPGTGRAIAMTVLALAAGAPTRAAELWRGPAGRGGCRLELVNELGGVGLTAGDPAARSAVVHGDPALRIEPSAPTERPLLMVAWAGAPAGGAGEVAVVVPRRCRVTVRTTHGRVSLEVGRAAFPALIETVTGDITAWVHPDTDAAVAFATSGRITTDFTIAIERRYHEPASKHGWITPKAESSEQEAGATVRLNSRAGGIRMLRPPRDHPLPSPETRDDDEEHD